MFLKKTYSAKVKSAAADWLRQFGKSLDTLTDTQQGIIFDHVKKVRMKNFLWLSAVGACLYVFAGFFGYFVSKNLIKFQMDLEVEAIEPSVLSKFIFLQYVLSGYSFSCFIIAFFMFLSIGLYLLQCSRNEKIIKAFL